MEITPQMPLSSCYLEIGHPRFYGLAAWTIGYLVFMGLLLFMQVNLDYNLSCHENRPITLFWLFFLVCCFIRKAQFFLSKLLFM